MIAFAAAHVSLALPSPSSPPSSSPPSSALLSPVHPGKDRFMATSSPALSGIGSNADSRGRIRLWWRRRRGWRRSHRVYGGRRRDCRVCTPTGPWCTGSIPTASTSSNYAAAAAAAAAAAIRKINASTLTTKTSRHTTTAPCYPAVCAPGAPTRTLCTKFNAVRCCTICASTLSVHSCGHTATASSSPPPFSAPGAVVTREMPCTLDASVLLSPLPRPQPTVPATTRPAFHCAAR
jgi:hypothetical protein